MVTKRIRSEYMKKFKDPKWETYTKCYEEMLKYRLARRLLEQTHNPWFWSGSDSDSDSAGRTPPPPPNKNQVQDETVRAGTEAELEECQGARTDKQPELQASTAGPVPRLHIQEQENGGSQLDGVKLTRVPEEEREEQRARGSKQLPVSHRVRDQEAGQHRTQQSKPPKSSKQTWTSHRVRPAPSRLPKEESKGSRHSFALYASGEKHADIGARKTHNVGPTASTTEIHESALRAKTRREVERQIQTHRAERRRAKSVELDKPRKVVQPEFNPWLTEYMRCFSARSQ
ncbi:centriole, cilia and spindle-associated protein [Hippoglossus hippoglossus]|uniref:centriole, cilia and spindle-associated protein n=1 Tax=Hippoglossus hippoglossus TaxID=8267 RepID=UPI00148CC495|nr:centriole, cilia and spindle-associated protein [Hippoglossus hippoglossus]XP_034435089.1 centriole, cilia and spindle-associated protein [Hippoglossus hippoglossus]XP_035006204.1 centriole, cilia and spindle-associated protein [Hippoglossus stenolepis]XP_035006295.1 centriole, cilia and spindle-associated protein [Hippoglossus stenolepis]XP_035006380.1 centriole, cilia and spindle-associated protein [Hippoglossus stenolepis]XP_035006463.1 centriole, cilia and spindle-associated protein [Hi